MGPLVLLLSFSLSLLSPVTSVTLFKQTGKDLLLEVKGTITLEENDQITWTVNGKDIARLDDSGKTRIFRDFSGRAKLFPQNQSLLLRNLTKSDSGDYKARVSSDDPKDIANYTVTVLDPVSPVNLTVNNCSSDSSNLTVTCSTQDSLLSRTFTCDKQSCSEERGERAEFTTPAASLKVYLKEDSIICVHSNQVSRTEDVRKIDDFCEKDPEPTALPLNTGVGWIVPLIIVLVALVLLIIGVVGVMVYRRRKRQYKTESMDNTVYELPQVPHSTLPLEQRPMNDAPSDDLPPTIYHLLGHPMVPEASTGAEVKLLPESVYATVQKVAKT